MHPIIVILMQSSGEAEGACERGRVFASTRAVDEIGR